MTTIKIERVRNEIWVQCPYTPRSPAACKSVHGAKWNKDKKVWTYPLLWAVCLELRSKIAEPLGIELELGPAMYKWAMEEKTRQDSIPDVLSLHSVPLPVVEANNQYLFSAMENRPFQTVGASFIAQNKEALLADDPGLGKTLQVIAAIQEAKITGPILVVAPKAAAQITWPGELNRWTSEETDDVLVFGADIPPNQRNLELNQVFKDCERNPNGRIWVIMNPYWIRAKAHLDEWNNYIKDEHGVKKVTSTMPILFRRPWSTIVMDESHQVLAGSTGNKKKWSQQRLGAGALDLLPSGLRVAISGTPFRGKPENLFGTLNWLRPDLYTSYWKWVERHFEMFEDDWGAKAIGGLKDEEAFYREAATVMIRRTKAQVAPDLPPKMYGGEPLDKMDPDSVVGVWLPMLPEQAKLYKQMVESASAELDGGALMANGILAEMTRLKQFANSAMGVSVRGTTKKRKSLINKLDKDGRPELDPWTDEPVVVEAITYEEEEETKYRPTPPSNKLDWIVEFLTDRDLIGAKARGQGKVLIASQFTGLINMFAEELRSLGTLSFVLTGETSNSKRKQIVEDFQNNPDSAKVFLINTKAGGVALTLDAADDVIIVDETFIPDDQLQVEDRAHRLSRIDHNVTIWYLRSLGTIEESIGATTQERDRVCRGVIDGQRGVSIAKALLGR